MTDPQHPCDIAADAGRRAWTEWRMDERQARTVSRDSDDPDGFMDAYWTARHETTHHNTPKG